MKDPRRDHLECPFCLGVGQVPPDDYEKIFGYVSVLLEDQALLDRHFKKDLPEKLDCPTCGASGEKSVGCCKLTYRWIRRKAAHDYRDVARFECSDCGISYHARIVKQNDRYEIGEKVPAPPAGVQIRNQRMLCGDCQGKGGKGDQLNDLLRLQRGGHGRDPFGLF